MNKSTPVILFRGSLAEEGEETIVRSIWSDNRVFTSRTAIPPHSCVVGRYSVLPYYKECEEDLKFNNSVLVNSHRQHVWISSFSYYYDIADYTFPSWNASQYPYVDYDGPVVIKGATNSMKMSWNTHMFAADRKSVHAVVSRLHDNAMISQQGLIFRKYIPLAKVTVDNGLNGLPLTEEYRLFFYRQTYLAGGFYWANLCEESVVKAHGTVPDAAIALGRTVAAIASDHVNFFVVDVARTQSGEWICVEINDGQMSGLSAVCPVQLYTRLKDVLSSSPS